jgi:hypothetical protein
MATLFPAQDPPALNALPPGGVADGAKETASGTYLVTCATPQVEAVVNRADEELGELEHFVIDLPSGRIAYAVLVRGGVFGLGERLHAIPWEALQLDADERRFVLDMAKDRLDAAPGFDEEHWPAMTDAAWAAAIREFYAPQRAAHVATSDELR